MYCSCEGLNSDPKTHVGWLMTIDDSRTLWSPGTCALTCTYPYTLENKSWNPKQYHIQIDRQTHFTAVEQWTYDLPAPASQVAGVQAWLSDSALLSCDSSHIITFSHYKVVAAALIIYWKFSMWSVKRAQMRMEILGAMSLVAMISFCAVNLQAPLFSLFAGIL